MTFSTQEASYDQPQLSLIENHPLYLVFAVYFVNLCI